MQFIKVILVLLIPALAMAHEGHQAFYRLHVENGMLMMDVKVEQPDVQTSIEKSGICSKGQDVNLCAGNWLIDQLSVAIDGKTHSLTLESTMTEEGHLVVSYSLGDLPEKPTSIEIGNTAFLDAFGNYDNIIQIDIPQLQQGYKMSAARKLITIDLPH